MSEHEHGFITRGVTIVDWPWIPNKKIKDYIGDYCRDRDIWKDTTISFECIIESLVYESEEEDKPELILDIKMLEDFMAEYNLKSEDSIRYWW